MANLFLEQNDTFTLAPMNTGVSVFGSTGTESVILDGNPEGTLLDGNVETVQLAGNAADTSLEVNDQTGQLELTSGGTTVATFTSGLNQEVDLQFEDGNVTLDQEGANSFTLADPDDDTDNVTIDTGTSQTSDAVSLGDETSSAGDDDDDDDDDADGTSFTLTASSNSVDEGGSVTYTVKTDQDIAADTSLQVSLQGDDLNGNATAATLNDDVTVSQNTVTFAAGAKAGDTVQFTVDAKSDSTVESLEGFKVSLLDENFDAAASDIVSINDTTQPTGQSLVLTNTQNQNTGGADNLTGAGADDSFIATADGALGNGDVIDGAGGTDTLTARYVLDDDTSVSAAVSNVEQFNVDIDEGDANNAETLTMAAGFTGLSEVNVRNADSTDGNEDTVSITQVADGVDLGVENGDGEFNVTFALATATGTSDAVTANLDTADVNTVTIDAVETVTLNAENGDSEIDTLTTDDATTLNITGSGGLTTDVDAATTTIDASAATGDLSLTGIGGVDSAITMGSGSDTVNMAGNLDADDTIDGGDGTDRVIVSGSETAELTGLSNVEELALENNGIVDGTTVTLSGTVSSELTNFVASANAAADDADVTFAATNLDSGDTVTVTTGGADTSTLADGVGLTTAFATDSASDELSLVFSGIGAVDTDASAGTGLANVEVDEVETLTIASNANAAGDVTVNEVEQLDAAVATSITLTGAADFTTDDDTDGVVNTTALTSIDASAMTGDLTLSGVDASDLTLTDGSGDLSLTIAGLNNADTIDGGDDEDGDTVTATGVSGLTATTGALDVSNIENLIIQADGANTFDLSSASNVGVFAISGATPGTQTLTNVAAGQVIALGEDAAEFVDGDELDVTLADATGTSDALTINVNNTDGADTDAVLDISDVETITLDVAAATNAASVGVANAEASTLNVVDGAAGAVLALGNLNAATSTVDLSDYDGEVTFSGANVTSGMTVTASSSAAADDYTLSGEDDTITIAETGAVDVIVDGGAGTDTMNLTVGTGFVDTGEIDNFENLNLTVAAGADIFIGANGTAGTDANAIAEATNVTITGGNSLSTFEVGDSDGGSADNITAAVDIDASAFAGNVFLEYAADVFTETTDVSAGSLTTDTVYALFDAANTDIALPLTGVERFVARLDSGDDGAEQYNFDVNGASGLSTLEAWTDGAANFLDVDDYVSTLTVQLGSTIAGATQSWEQDSSVDINLASASGSSDTVNLALLATDNGAGTVDVDAAGVEILNISLDDNATESHVLDLAGVTASTGESVTVNISGGVAGDGLTISNAGSTIDTIDASESDGSLTISDRDASAMTITGGSDADTIRMENAADVLTGGDGTDTLELVQNAVLGGFKVDLSASGDQVTTYNGAANAAVQSGFENVDLSGITGGNAADITANSDGSVITGTSNTDQITLGGGDDDLVFVSKADGGSDVISGFATTADDIDFNGDLVTGTAGQGTGTDGNNVNYSGSAIVDLTADTAVADGTAGAIFNVNEDLTITSGDSVADIEADAATQLSDGGADFSDNFAANEGGLILMDNGTDTFLFEYQADDDTTDADEINLIGILSGVDDSDTLVAGDFI